MAEPRSVLIRITLASRLHLIHSAFHVLTPPLASAREIDEAVNNLVSDLELVRVLAKKS